MSFLQIAECNGCGARTDPAGPVQALPSGWRFFTIKPLASRPGRDGGHIAVCPACWNSKTCAEVLGHDYGFLAESFA